MASHAFDHVADGTGGMGGSGSDVRVVIEGLRTIGEPIHEAFPLVEAIRRNFGISSNVDIGFRFGRSREPNIEGDLGGRTICLNRGLGRSQIELRSFSFA